MDVVVNLSCPDRPGIVARVSQLLLQRGANIIESQQFNDPRNDVFFMRIVCSIPPDGPTEATLHEDFNALVPALDMTFQIRRTDAPVRMLVMVSSSGHCLNDLLFRWRTGAINADIPVIVSNHLDLEPLAAAYQVPFVHIPVTAATKAEAEAALRVVLADYQIDLVVLARYMQVLSDDLAGDFPGRIINIHHSFLPSFKGAKPYHQAFARGVKLIGATAHYVTADLDEGPIIEQDVIRVDHRMSAVDLVRSGQECESRVLARAVTWHCQSRVILNLDRTVVFS
ncbi:MAG: formyltetrahydrofolate deformylase [Nostocoides sp.]